MKVIDIRVHIVLLFLFLFFVDMFPNKIVIKNINNVQFDKEVESNFTFLS